MDDPIRTVLDSVLDSVLDRALADDPGRILGVYLIGSSTMTGLGPESDIDLLLLTRKSLIVEERRSPVSLLLGLSGWKGHAEDFPDVAGRRPFEATSLVADTLDPLKLGNQL
ncbi:hypothetical protein [Dietzia sp. PP-33]|uniref:hypothetical protein n=1 Tax=Dietzia sp. PP-33 TaxID=2957500 RepID=UPI0039B11B5A